MRWLDERAYAPGIAVALAVLLFWLWANCGVGGCPDVRRLVAYQPGGATVLLDRNGEHITDLAPVRHEVVPLEDLPEHVADAFIAVEDQRFRDHSGVDVRRIGGAMLANVKAGGIAEGSSTITMQLSRNVFADRLPAGQRTIGRKLLEARVALEIEDQYDKDEILELYLNHIFFGGSAYGIAAGARRHFDRDASDLTLSQAALLAALPKAPSNYDPIEYPERARERRDLVLSLMADQGRITADEAEDAMESPLRARRGEVRGAEPEERLAGWFVDRVRGFLEDELGEDLYYRPMVVHTTMDLGAQRAAERALERQLRWIERGGLGPFDAPRPGSGTADSLGTDYLQGAVVVMDADSGDVLALVGGRDYSESAFDRATRALRQAGSTIKPFVYAAAIEQGWSPTDTLMDEPLELELDGRAWSPRNFDDRFAGPVTLRQSLVGSRNVPTVRLASDVGTEDVAGFARDAGVSSSTAGPMFALGITAVSPLQMTAAFTTFATLGERVRPRLVLRVEDADGNRVWESEPDRKRVLEAGVAYVVTDMLQEAVDAGTARRVREVGFRGPAAGKTGTTNDAADAWYVGYTPELVGTVWIGFDRRRTISSRASGGRAAAPVWGRLMREIQRVQPEDWQRPDEAVELAIDSETGLPIDEDCELEDGARDGLRTELFLADADIETVCPDDGEPGLLDRIWSWIRGVLGLDDDDEDEEERPERRRQPRIDRPRTAERERPDEPQPLGIELDELEALDEAELEERLRQIEGLELDPGAVLPAEGQVELETEAPPRRDGPPGQQGRPTDDDNDGEDGRGPPADTPGRGPPQGEDGGDDDRPGRGPGNGPEGDE